VAYPIIFKFKIFKCLLNSDLGSCIDSTSLKLASKLQDRRPSSNIINLKNIITLMKTTQIEKELNEIRFMLEKIEGIIDSRLIGVEEPDEDEVVAIEAYEKLKKEGKLQLNEM